VVVEHGVTPQASGPIAVSVSARTPNQLAARIATSMVQVQLMPMLTGLVSRNRQFRTISTATGFRA
jgi:hypothetical protein